MTDDTKKKLNFRKVFLYVIVPFGAVLFLIFKLFGSSSTTDLQTILQNLPKEITDFNKNQYNEDMLKEFKELSEQLMEQNKKQQSMLEAMIML